MRRSALMSFNSQILNMSYKPVKHYRVNLKEMQEVEKILFLEYLGFKRNIDTFSLQVGNSSKGINELSISLFYKNKGATLFYPKTVTDYFQLVTSLKKKYKISPVE